MDIHVPVPCIEKIILSLQNWNNLSLSFFFSSNFPPIESVLQVAIKVIFKNHASYDMSSMLKILQ